MSIGTIRAVSVRKGTKHGPAAGETLVMMDRTNPDLGNPYPLSDPNDDVLRDECVGLFVRVADSDMRKKAGPIYRAVCELAGRVADGERIAGGCWCKPKACHADYIARLVTREAARIHAERGREAG